MKILNCITAAVLAALLLNPDSALGQSRNQADVQIQSIHAASVPPVSPSSTAYLLADVTVYSYWDDSARNVVLTVLLPVEVTVLNVSTGCAPIQTANGAWHSAVQCNLGNLQVGQSSTIKIATTLPRIATVRRTFGAFAWSLTPDPMPSNNYGEATAP